jgi:hypothetical protein
MMNMGTVKGKSMNPLAPGMNVPYTKSPILAGGGKPMTKSPILGKSSTASGSLDKVIKPNLKNMGKSIKPTIKSKPIKEGY